MATKRRLTEQGEIRFYEWLENMIEKEGSAKRFSENTGLGESEVSKLRKSIKEPTRYTVEMLAKAYGLTAQDIVGKDGIGEDIVPRGDRTGLPKKKKEEKPEELTKETEAPLADSWEMVLRGQIDCIYQDIMKLEEEIRQLKMKKIHYDEILSIYHDWRSDHAD